ELDQSETLSGFLTRHPQPLSGYTFATLATWQSIFEYGWILTEGETLLLSCVLEPEKRRHLMQPVGTFPAAVQLKLIQEAKALPYPLKIVGVNEGFIAQSPEFLRNFTAHEDQAASNYLYLAESLAQLPGRKYSKKRNLLAQAAGQYCWSPEPLKGSEVGACFEILKRIQEEEQPEMDSNLQQELVALEYTLQHFADLGQQGLLVKVDEHPVAFSIYEAISPSTVAIHFERALRRYKGLYQVINWETAQVIAAEGYEFINREEDLGSPGLRDAKRSYNPVEIIPAFELTFKSDIG
ncbi:MAG TPA: phosphatidylglycerol lysyltransferase domain-containing protein, partial [Acidobacteriota bacterium]|nr:phosphatidylglycerol lysyltransferase domain-containing protein [Acidobacteriota bacterium]